VKKTGIRDQGTVETYDCMGSFAKGKLSSPATSGIDKALK
jgi:hypothetical protein